MATHGEIDPGTVLEQASWVVALARQLARDEHEGEDLAQDAWVAALEARPDTRRPLGPWFARVMRNIARNRRRQADRRARREHRAARRDESPSAAALVERAAVLRELVGAVMALDEPVRATVLMRYLEELPTREIAARLDVPVRTVNTRLARGLERLRGRLDRSHGKREAWLVALAQPAVEEAAPPGPIATSALGTKILAAVLLLAVGSMVVARWFGTGTSADEAPATPRPTVDSVAGLRAGESRPEERRLLEAPLDGGSRLADPDLDRDLHGLVVTSEGAPIAGAEVRVLFPVYRQVPSHALEEEENRLVASLRTNARGEFLIPVTPGRVFDLEVRATGRAHRKVTDVYGGEFVAVELGREAVVFGRVTSGKDEAPVVGALVRASPGTPSVRDGARYEIRTSRDGTYRLDQLPAGLVRFEVLGGDGSAIESSLRIEAGCEQVLDFALTRRVTVRGRVTDAVTQRPLIGAQVGVLGMGDESVRTDMRGAYALVGLPRDRDSTLMARAAGHSAVIVTIRDGLGDGGEWDFALPPARRARGRIVDPSGGPVSGARVSAEASAGRHMVLRDIDGCAARTDVHGAFAIDGLRTDLRHSLLVRAPGWATTLLDFPARELDEQDVDLGEIRLSPPGALGGVLVDLDGQPIAGQFVDARIDVENRDALGPAESNAVGYLGGPGYGTGPVEAVTDSRGRFWFSDLPAGVFHVTVTPGGMRGRVQTEVCLKTGEVRGDIELVLDTGKWIEGVVIDHDGAPIPGLLVEAYADVRGLSFGDVMQSWRAGSRTDEHGTFRLGGLSPGDHSLHTMGDSLLPPGRPPAPWAPMEWHGIEAGDNGLRLQMPAPVFIAGRVVDAEGRPVAGCPVMPYCRLLIPSSGGMTDREGRFRFLTVEGRPLDLYVSPPVGGADSREERADTRGPGNMVIVSQVAPGTEDVIITLR